MDLLIQTIISLVVGGLGGLVGFFLKEKIKHSIQQKSQKALQNFNLSITSTMATTIFEKHTEFVEMYYAKVLDIFYTLRQSPSEYDDLERMLGCAGELGMLRLKYSVWLTVEHHESLEAYEDKIYDIGRYARYVNSPKGEGTDQLDRDKKANELLDIVNTVIDWKTTPTEHKEVHLTYIQKKLRLISGLDEVVGKRNEQLQA